jgi:hypothetical protein
MLVILNEMFFGSRLNRLIALTTRWSRTASTPPWIGKSWVDGGRPSGPGPAACDT